MLPIGKCEFDLTSLIVAHSLVHSHSAQCNDIRQWHFENGRPYQSGLCDEAHWHRCHFSRLARLAVTDLPPA